MQNKPIYSHSFTLRGQDEIDFQTCLSEFRAVDIFRLGIKEALKHCPKPPKEAIKKVKEIINK